MVTHLNSILQLKAGVILLMSDGLISLMCFPIFFLLLIRTPECNERLQLTICPRFHSECADMRRQNAVYHS